MAKCQARSIPGETASQVSVTNFAATSKTALRLDIIELNLSVNDFAISEKYFFVSVQNCSIVLITGSSNSIILSKGWTIHFINESKKLSNDPLRSHPSKNFEMALSSPKNFFAKSEIACAIQSPRPAKNPKKPFVNPSTAARVTCTTFPSLSRTSWTCFIASSTPLNTPIAAATIAPAIARGFRSQRMPFIRFLKRGIIVFVKMSPMSPMMSSISPIPGSFLIPLRSTFSNLGTPPSSFFATLFFLSSILARNFWKSNISLKVSPIFSNIPRRSRSSS